MLESISGTCAFEVPRNWKQLPAWSSELETGMSHFFGVAPRGVPRGVPLNPGVTTGLKEAILEFFSWESLGAGSAGLRCRAGGAAGWRTARNPGRVEVPRLGAAGWRSAKPPYDRMTV